MEINKALAKAQGKRLVELRHITRLSRRSFAIKHHMPIGSLRNWEEGRYNGLTQKAITQLIKAYSAENIDVTAEWLLYGKGITPKLLMRKTSVTTTETAYSTYENNIVGESKTEIIRKTKSNSAQIELNKELYDATTSNRYSDVVQLIKAGATLHLQSGIKINLYDARENTLLHIAVVQGYLEIVKLLLTKGTHVDVRNRRKQTPLHWAVHNRHSEIVQYLIQNGASIDAVEDEGGTPLSWAAYVAQINIANLLLEYGANINQGDMDGNAPIHWACYRGHTEMIKFLLEKGANPNQQNSSGLTPMTIAVENGDLKTTLLLMENI